MKRTSVLPVLAFVAAAALLCAVVTAEDSVEASIKISPNVLALRSAGNWLTIHTDLAYSTVDFDSVTLTIGDAVLAVDRVEVDDCGNYVAKFVLDNVKAVVAPPESTMTLAGSLKDGTAFAGTGTIRVKQ